MHAIYPAELAGVRMASALSESRHFSIVELRRGVWAAIAKDGGWAVCNAGVIDLGGETLVFDTFATPEAGSELRMTAERLTGQPVRVVVNSHRHKDHVRGNQVFADVDIVASGKTRVGIDVQGRQVLAWDREHLSEELAKIRRNPDDPDRLLWEGYHGGILQTLSTVELTLPNVTFEEELAFHGPKRTARVMTWGPGHTDSDSFLLLPEDQILFLGDLLFIRYQPSLGYGEPIALLRTLDRVEKLGVETLVPGHGPVGGPSDLESNREYVREVLNSLDRIEAPDTAENLAARHPIPPRFRDWGFRSFWGDNLEAQVRARFKPTSPPK